MTGRATLALGCAIAVTVAGCTTLPDGSRLEDGPAARRAVQAATGARLVQARPVVTPTGIAGQSFTYFGSAGGRQFTVVVFDNAGAARLLLGTLARRMTADGLGAVRSRNIVALYTIRRGAPDPAPALERSLDAIP